MAKTIKELSEQITGLQGIISGFHEKVTRELQELRTEVTKIGSDIKDIKQVALSAKQTAVANQQEIADLTKRVNDLADRSRRANLIISGVSEEIFANKLEQTLIEWLQSINIQIKPEEVERAHRLQRNGRGGAPRDVIIKFSHEKTQQQIYKELRQKKDLTFRGKKIWVRKDFCPDTIKKRNLMRPYAERLHANNFKFTWGYPSTIIIFKDGKRLIARDTTEARELLKQLGINTEDMRDQEMQEDPGIPEDEGEGTSGERGEKRLRTGSL